MLSVIIMGVEPLPPLSSSSARHVTSPANMQHQKVSLIILSTKGKMKEKHSGFGWRRGGDNGSHLGVEANLPWLVSGIHVLRTIGHLYRCHPRPYLPRAQLMRFEKWFCAVGTAAIRRGQNHAPLLQVEPLEECYQNVR